MPYDIVYEMDEINEDWDEVDVPIVLKRSMVSGYTGADNPLFVLENTRMLFGDANATMQAVLKALKG